MKDKPLQEASPNEQQSLTDVHYWIDQQPSDIQLPAGGTPPLWIREVTHFLPIDPSTKFLEIGVVPGYIMMCFASKFGYQCTGIDFSPKVNQLSVEFAKHGINARFIEADFFSWEPGEKFDIVYSNGFIEHFADYEDVVRRHWELVAPGGYLLIIIPTFTAPILRLIRRFFFTSQRMREVMDTHNTAMMNLGSLTNTVDKCTGSKILAASYTGGMNIWFRPNDPGIRRWTFPFWLLLKLLDRIVAKARVSSSLFSPLIMVLARKQQ